MSDRMSPLDGESGNSAKFETLEERIYNTSRPDNESDEAFVMEPWMNNQTSIIVNELNTSKVEVNTRAIYQGIQKVRNSYQEAQDIEDMKADFRVLLGNNDSDMGLMSTLRTDLDTITNNINTTPEGKASGRSPTWVPVKRSVVSEVIRFLGDNLYMTKTQIYRVLISSGFLDSSHITKETENYSKDILNSFVDSISEVRLEVESSISRYIRSSFYDWKQGGISDDNLEKISDIIDKMETEEKNEVGEVYNLLDNGGD